WVPLSGDQSPGWAGALHLGDEAGPWLGSERRGEIERSWRNLGKSLDLGQRRPRHLCWHFLALPGHALVEHLALMFGDVELGRFHVLHTPIIVLPPIGR